jgi:hypothetical protein
MNLQKFAERVAGWTTLSVIYVVLDYLLWPAVILKQGAIVGGLIMFWVTLLTNCTLIWAYDRIKRDVLSFEALRELTEGEHGGFAKRLIVKLVSVGRIPAFIAISFYDPFLSAIYMRKGAGKYKMEPRDWLYFSLGMIIACVGWTCCLKGFIVIVQAVSSFWAM